MHKSTKWLIGMIVLIFLMPFLASVLPKASPDENKLLHDFYKSLHILGAILFLGNIIVTGIWMFLAEKSKNLSIIQFGIKAVNWMDVFLTAPGVALILLTGFLLAPHHGGIYTQSWILAGLILFSFSGIIWLFALIPDQHRLIKLSYEGDKLPKKFYKVLHRWYFWGIIATILPLISLVIMVLKPKLW